MAPARENRSAQRAVRRPHDQTVGRAVRAARARETRTRSHVRDDRCDGHRNRVSTMAHASALTPSLLVAFPYLRDFLRLQDPRRYRNWVLDSGAFSVANRQHTVELADYITTCRHVLASGHGPVEVFALDVIGNATATLRNTDAMWRAGIPAIPTYHFGEPESDLLSMARTYPKIAIGGLAGQQWRPKLKWAMQVFARVWPKRIHGFAFGSANPLLAMPFHSVDSATWELAPCGLGRWQEFGDMTVPRDAQDLRSQIAWHLDLEVRARVRWRAQMRELDATDANAPAVRLAIATGRFWRQAP